MKVRDGFFGIRELAYLKAGIRGESEMRYGEKFIFMMHNRVNILHL